MTLSRLLPDFIPCFVFVFNITYIIITGLRIAQLTADTFWTISWIIRTNKHPCCRLEYGIVCREELVLLDKMPDMNKLLLS